MSVRFLGRRVYLGFAVVLMSADRVEVTSTVAQLGRTLDVPARTIQRWRNWWIEQFPLTPLWQAECARFIPPIVLSQLPDSLINRFAATAEEILMRLLVFLSPLTVGNSINSDVVAMKNVQQVLLSLFVVLIARRSQVVTIFEFAELLVDLNKNW
jgi:hypothetical protein